MTTTNTTEAVDTTGGSTADNTDGSPTSIAAQWQFLGVLGTLAEGSISPMGKALSTNKSSAESKFFAALERCYAPTLQRTIASCIDGRLEAELENTAQTLTPNAAGGSLALWVAACLSGAELSLKDFLSALAAAGLPIGGHSDEHAHGAASGCGANDKLERILSVLSAPATAPFLRATAERLGFATSEETLTGIFQQSTNLVFHSAAKKLGSAPARLELLAQFGNAPLLAGGHTEQLVVLNRVVDTTLNRQTLFATLGKDCAIFNVDIWAIKNSADAALRALADCNLPDTPHLDTFCTALLFYNLSTALVLCAPDMPVAIRNETRSGENSNIA